MKPGEHSYEKEKSSLDPKLNGRDVDVKKHKKGRYVSAQPIVSARKAGKQEFLRFPHANVVYIMLKRTTLGEEPKLLVYRVEKIKRSKPRMYKTNKGVVIRADYDYHAEQLREEDIDEDELFPVSE